MKRKPLRRKWIAPMIGISLLIPAVVPMPALAAVEEAKVKAVEFIGMDAPKTAVEMAAMYTTASVKVTYANGITQIFPLTYKTLFKSTDQFNGTAAGTPIDVNGKPIMDNSVPGNPVPFVSDAPDANSLFKVSGAKPTGQGGNPLELLTHFEYISRDNAGQSAYGLVPASISHATIDQNPLSGELQVANHEKVDVSSVDGLWIPCNGSLTPWGTHLSSEEYDADARAFEADNTKTYVGSMAKYFFQDENKIGNPYAYGYIPEVTVHSDGSTSIVKHYSLGRFSHELGKVAPDRKTVFFGDDGSNVMLFLYVADKAEDLSAGTLYAAKWEQTGTDNGGSADLKWIELGHASDAEVKAYIDRGIKFSDIFETSDKTAGGFTAVKTYPSSKVEYLKVKPGMEQAATFLESRRYGAIIGATSEFNKMEGIAVNEKDKKLYVAISSLDKGMGKDSKGTEPSDDIQLPKIKAGVTYELALKPGQKDSSNNPIQSSYVPVTMSGLVVGEDLAKPDALGNTAAVDKVANTDNLSYSEAMRTLFIGEDSGMHTNNYVWAYNVDTKKLSRILSVPSGAEATGLQAVDNLNGFSYIMSNFQHPGDELDEKAMPEELKQEVMAEIDKAYDNKKAGTVGYISGFPVTDKMVQWKSKGKAKQVVLREAAEGKNAKVEWHPEDRSVTIKDKAGRTLWAKDGSAVVNLDGEWIQLPEAVKIVNSRMMIMSDVMESFLTSK